VCWKPCSSCRSFHLLREEFLSAPIHSPLLWFVVSVLQNPRLGFRRRARRRSPPVAAGLRTPLPAACSRPEPSDLDPTRPAVPAAHKPPQPPDLDPTGPDLVNPSQARSNPRRPDSFTENPPSFPEFTDIPFHLRRFLTV
jgi:hypothetical protein